MRFRALPAVVVLATAVTTGPSHADGPDHLIFGSGAYDFLDEDTAAVFEAELRPGWRIGDGLLSEDIGLAPFVGGWFTTEGSAYGYAGLGVEWVIDDHYVIFPFSGFGFYNRGGGKDLGSFFEFRSGVELGYRFDNGYQLGLNVTHLSNAGISDTNPGTELITFRLAAPLGGSLHPND